MPVVIIESPSKIKYFEKYLGAGYKALATYGHIRDLPTEDIGVDTTTFKPEYVMTSSGKKALAKIKKALASDSEVIIATDTDREGEAIAWHIVETLKLKNYTRIKTNEITLDGIRNALANPVPLDLKEVAAQETRRVADRLVGWLISSAVSDAVGRYGLSAGRVQSPAIRMVVENHRAIEDHTAQTYYEIHAQGEGFVAVMDTEPFNDKTEKRLLDPDVARAFQGITALDVNSVVEAPRKKQPAAPFVTASLQQHMSKKLRWQGTDTMKVAQSLYEKGFITYIRTDAKTLSDTAYQQLLEYYDEQNLTKEPKRRTWKSPEGAHEAIRPTAFTKPPVSLSSHMNDDECLLYTEIWNRTVACQLIHAKYSDTVITFNGPAGGGRNEFKAKASFCVDAGFQTLLQEELPDDDGDGNTDINTVLPVLKEGQVVEVVTMAVNKRTKPPKRFDEARLTAAMEKMGIGRPSTYAEIHQNLRKRGYVSADTKGMYTPSNVAIEIVDALTKNCAFVDYGFTSLVESWLDKIVAGEATYLDVIAPLHTALNKDKNKLIANKFPCPACGEALRRFATKPSGSKSLRSRSMAQKASWGCSGHFNDPPCTYSCTDDNGQPRPEAMPA